MSLDDDGSGFFGKCPGATARMGEQKENDPVAAGNASARCLQWTEQLAAYKQ